MAKYTAEKIAEMENWIVWHSRKFWEKAQNFYGIRINSMPKTKMNSRLTSTAGRAFIEENYTDYSCYLLLRNTDEFKNNTIPHELCHHIAFRLYGDRGHGKAWKKVMVEMGLKPDTYHNMETLHMANNKAR